MGLLLRNCDNIRNRFAGGMRVVPYLLAWVHVLRLETHGISKVGTQGLRLVEEVVFGAPLSSNIIRGDERTLWNQLGLNGIGHRYRPISLNSLTREGILRINQFLLHPKGYLNERWVTIAEGQKCFKFTYVCWTRNRLEHIFVVGIVSGSEETRGKRVAIIHRRGG